MTTDATTTPADTQGQSPVSASTPDTQNSHAPSKENTNSRPPKGRFPRMKTIAGSKPDDFVFDPRESSFFTLMPVTLASSPVQVAHGRVWERTALSLFEIDLIVPIIAPTEEKARVIGDAATAQLDNVKNWIVSETAKTEKIIADNGVGCDGQFSQPQELQVRVFSPASRTMLTSFGQMDTLVLNQSRLWMAAFMDNIAYKKACFAARVKLVQLGRGLWELHSRSVKALYVARSEAIREANEALDEASRERAKARAEKASAIITKIEEREAREAAEGLVDPLGQRELEVEMGMTVEEAEAEEKKAAKKPRKKAAAAA